MEMRNENVGLDGPAVELVPQRLSQHTEAGATIEDIGLSPRRTSTQEVLPP